MGAIRESGNEIREKYEAYNKELNKVSSELSKVCAICTKPITITKDGVIRQCDQCVYKKEFQRRMEHVRQSLELNND